MGNCARDRDPGGQKLGFIFLSDGALSQNQMGQSILSVL